MTETRICDKLSNERIQFVFTSGLPSGDFSGILGLDTEAAIETAYGVNASEMKSLIEQTAPSAEVSLAEATLGYGAPGEGWLIEVAKISTYIAGGIVAWYELGKIVLKMKRGISKYLEDRGCEFPTPILNVFALRAIAINRFLKYRRKSSYEAGDLRMVLGVRSASYEHGEVYALPIWKVGFPTIHIVVIDCYGRVRGKVRFRAPSRNPYMKRKRGEFVIGW